MSAALCALIGNTASLPLTGLTDRVKEIYQVRIVWQVHKNIYEKTLDIDGDGRVSRADFLSACNDERLRNSFAMLLPKDIGCFDLHINERVDASPISL